MIKSNLINKMLIILFLLTLITSPLLLTIVKTSANLVSSEEFMKWKVFGDFQVMIRLTMNPEEMLDPTNEVMVKEMIKEEEKKLAVVEHTFREAAKRFFDGDASDLILLDCI